MQALYLYFVFDIFDTDVDQIPSHTDIKYQFPNFPAGYSLIKTVLFLKYVCVKAVVFIQSPIEHE